ncbi:hypothetical protein DPM19_00240 [Actinomadura craniellae]|uniref:Uncharacterized protein n=1 Tax=Actinomadura craniellae TaxID=2231787 RepID=A0A365HC04_9ACTN|nr:hypothetical protein [Actinomadura craniellae]RAY16654.1 hypothetical protein DPM19_00240 [Actinomadura craniellae]
MVVFLGLARRAVTELERCANTGLDALVTLTRGPDRTAELMERLQRLEDVLAGQAAGLTDVRHRLDALVDQLNEQLLPGIDERMDETERDLARLATGLMRGDRDADRRETRLCAAEQRLTDLRERVGRTEQRASLWRDLQATLAGLAEEVDRLHARLTPADPLPEREPLS